MLTARKGAMLSNGVFLQGGDFVKITYVDGNIVEGRIKCLVVTEGYMTVDVNIEDAVDYWDIEFADNQIKDIQLA